MSSRDQITIKVAGTALQTETAASLQECVVDQSIYLPDHVSLLFQDHRMELMDSSTFDIGKAITVEVGISQAETGEDNAAKIFEGEVTALEPIFEAATGNNFVVRGYSKNWRGFRGSNQRTFLNQKDSQVVTSIIGDLGLTADAETTAAVHEFLAQDNQSDTEFIVERAQRLGFKVFTTEDGKLNFKKAEATSGSLTLTLGENLQSFRPSVTAANQVDKVTVKGWDGKQKEVITGSASSSNTHPSINIGGSGGSITKSAFGAAELQLVDQPIIDAAEAEKVAQGRLDNINGSFIQAEGIAHGNPGIRPGVKLTLNSLGQKFSGSYVVTSATHVYSNEVYETTFTVSGTKTNTLASQVNRQEPMRRWYGVYPALVTNLQDPDNLGRIKVKIPWLSDNFESDWARIATLNAGPERGIEWLPEVDDEVLVAFEHGDMNRPYILGSLWNSKDKPVLPSNQVVSGGKVQKRIFKSRKGHQIIFDDTDGSESITIITHNEKNSLVANSAENSLTIQVEGDATINAKGKMNLQSTQDMTIESKANLTIRATGDMKLDVTKNLTAEAKLNATLKGLQLTAEGKTKADLKGLTVAVQGSTLTEVKGALVKIN